MYRTVRFERHLSRAGLRVKWILMREYKNWRERDGKGHCACDADQPAALISREASISREGDRP